MNNIYEIFGFNPFFSSHMAQFLRGASEICEDYSGGSLYTFFGIIAIVSAVLIYVLKYHWIFDKARFSYRMHWWISTGSVFVLNFAIAFIYLWNFLSSGVLAIGCDDEFISVIFNLPNIAMFAIVNAVFSVLFFALLSCPSWPFLRKLSKQCFDQTPWKR